MQLVNLSAWESLGWELGGLGCAMEFCAPGRAMEFASQFDRLIWTQNRVPSFPTLQYVECGSPDDDEGNASYHTAHNSPNVCLRWRSIRSRAVGGGWRW